MKKISFKSPLGILMFVILPLALILAFSGIRLDLTKEKRYTLSENTVKVLESVKKPVMVDVYLEGIFLQVLNNCRARQNLCWKSSEK